MHCLLCVNNCEIPLQTAWLSVVTATDRFQTRCDSVQRLGVFACTVYATVLWRWYVQLLFGNEARRDTTFGAVHSVARLPLKCLVAMLLLQRWMDVQAFLLAWGDSSEAKTGVAACVVHAAGVTFPRCQGPADWSWACINPS